MEVAMEDLKPVIAGNITALRKSMGLTQAELAAKLNYTDKAVSKWERGESVPDIAVLKSIADVFSVSVDYLLKDNSKAPPNTIRPGTKKYQKRNHLVISLLSAALVYLVATCVYVVFGLCPFKFSFHLSMVYLYALPAALIVFLVFNSLWGIRKLNFIIISLLMWSVLLAVYLTLLPMDIRLIFIIGIPAQIIILLWANLKLK